MLKPECTSGVDEQVQTLTSSCSAGSGWSLGNAGGWFVSKMTNALASFNVRGIKQMMGLVASLRAIGDAAGIYAYFWHDGGVTAMSDEGGVLANLQGGETQGYYRGTVVGSGPVISPSSTNVNWVTDGAFLLNISKGTISGNLAGRSLPVAATQLPNTSYTLLNALPVSNKLPLTSAWGMVTTPVSNPGVLACNSVPVKLSVRLGAIGTATPSLKPGVVSVAGQNYPEQALITAVGPVVNGTQQITINLRNPNQTLAIFQGGVAGQFLSFDQNLAFSGMRSTYYAFGSLTGSDLIYASALAGNIVNNIHPMIGYEAQTLTGGYHLYPGAEIVGTRMQPPDSNGNQNPGLDGTAATSPVLEPNTVTWDVGDVIECPHHTAVSANGLLLNGFQNTPVNPSFGAVYARVQWAGTGVNGGATFLALGCNNPTSYYQQGGGPLLPPTAMEIGGPFGNILDIQNGPMSGNAILRVRDTFDGTPAPYMLYAHDKCGAQLVYFPETKTLRWNQNLEVTGSTQLQTCTPTAATPGVPGQICSDGQNLYWYTGSGWMMTAGKPVK